MEAAVFSSELVFNILVHVLEYTVEGLVWLKAFNSTNKESMEGMCHLNVINYVVVIYIFFFLADNLCICIYTVKISTKMLTLFWKSIIRVFLIKPSVEVSQYGKC